MWARSSTQISTGMEKEMETKLLTPPENSRKPQLFQMCSWKKLLYFKTPTLLLLPCVPSSQQKPDPNMDPNIYSMLKSCSKSLFSTVLPPWHSLCFQPHSAAFVEAKLFTKIHFIFKTNWRFWKTPFLSSAVFPRLRAQLGRGYWNHRLCLKRCFGVKI